MSSIQSNDLDYVEKIKKLWEEIKPASMKAKREYVMKYYSNEKIDFVYEWIFINKYEDTLFCICSKNPIENLYIIKNKINDNTLSLGSECIKEITKNAKNSELRIEFDKFKCKRCDLRDRNGKLCPKCLKKYICRNCLDCGMIKCEKKHIASQSVQPVVIPTVQPVIQGCLDCGKVVNPKYTRCYTCNKKNQDKLPRCGLCNGPKTPGWPTCYNCRFT